MALVEVSVGDGYATVTINRPEVLNALNRNVLEELDAAWSTLEEDAQIRAAIMTGAGERAFVAGADIREIQSLSSPTAAEAFSRYGQSVLDHVAASRIFSIVAINGFALGGGLELAMAGDYRILAEEAQVGQPEILLGIIPGFGGTQRLKDLIGAGRALWLIASGERIDAARAMSWGLAEEMVPRAELLERARGMAKVLGARPPLALEAAKRAVRAGGALSDRLHAEAAEFGLVALSEDAREGTAAFLEKRTATFRGR